MSSSRTAAKSTAAKATPKPARGDADSVPEGDPTHSHAAVQRGGDVKQDEGPGTGREASPDERGRTQARMAAAHAADPAAAPIEAPDLNTATTPVEGHHGSSTNDVRGAVALASYPGEDHEAIVDEKGQAIDPADLWEEDGNPAATFVRAKQRVFETYYAVGQSMTGAPLTRLLFPAGAVVPKPQAYAMKASQERALAQLGQRKDANEAIHGTPAT